MSLFAPKPGCPMCSIAQAAARSPIDSPAAPLFPNTPRADQPEVLWRDDNFTAYIEKNNPVSSKGHIIIPFNLHVPSVYSLSSSDLPLLVQVQRRAQQLLHVLQRTPRSPDPYRAASPMTTNSPLTTTAEYNIGFITPPFKDNKIPVTDHLHLHAYIGDPDLAGWWRKVAYSSIAWYAIEDLIAEIRESSSNNRVKSGYKNRGTAPIDMVPDAGSRTGRPDGIETTEHGIAVNDLESGDLLTPPAPYMGRSSSPNHSTETL